jgi:hypothetical protein
MEPDQHYRLSVQARNELALMVQTLPELFA